MNSTPASTIIFTSIAKKIGSILNLLIRPCEYKKIAVWGNSIITISGCNQKQFCHFIRLENLPFWRNSWFGENSLTWSRRWGLNTLSRSPTKDGKTAFIRPFITEILNKFDNLWVFILFKIILVNYNAANEQAKNLCLLRVLKQWKRLHLIQTTRVLAEANCTHRPAQVRKWMDFDERQLHLLTGLASLAQKLNLWIPSERKRFLGFQFQ